MNKKAALIVAAAVLAATAVIGGTLAGYNTQTEKDGSVDISMKDLGITIADEEVATTDSVTVDTYVPGETVSLGNFTVKNDVAEGYDLYTRVTIYKSWDDSVSSNDFVPDSSLISLYEDGQELKLSGSDQTTIINNWILWYADDEQMIFYYQYPLKSGDATSSLLDSIKLDSSIDNAYADKSVYLEFVADAVQVIKAESSMPSEWGVYPTIDGDGKITAISE